MYTTFTPSSSTKGQQYVKNIQEVSFFGEVAGYLILTLLKVTLFHLGSLCIVCVKNNKLVSMYTDCQLGIGELKKYVQTVQNYCNNILVPSVVVLCKLLPFMLKYFPIYTMAKCWKGTSGRVFFFEVVY